MILVIISGTTHKSQSCCFSLNSYVITEFQKTTIKDVLKDVTAKQKKGEKRKHEPYVTVLVGGKLGHSDVVMKTKIVS